MAFILVIIAAAVAALIWCFIGFTRALREPQKLVGWLFSPKINLGRPGKTQALLVEFPGSQSEQVPARQGARWFQSARAVKPVFRLRLDLSHKGRDVKPEPLNGSVNRLN